jgi:hypothetical protein
MRFIADGPNIPDELLVARDAGDVILFCGAGVSQQEAHLPSFAGLARKVVEILGAAHDSRGRVLLERALAIDPMPGVGSLVATDRVFGLLEQEFEIPDVRAAVAEAIRPIPNARLDAHRVLLDLATARAVTRLVTTNFDLLFEACNPDLASSGPPSLPDPHSDREFRGVVHLHGRVDAAYRFAQDEEFVVSSADFGRAYLSMGWATRFIQKLLSRFQILFIGYTADDPPMQYLLEGLNLRAGTRNRLYAFQSGEQDNAIALWEHRGVQAIPFDSSNGFAPLWDTLRAWAERARDSRAWFERVLTRAALGPPHLAPHERGQVAHTLSVGEGARRLASAPEPLGAEWLLVADPVQRYGTPRRHARSEEGVSSFDPFEALGLDSDRLPDPPDREDAFRDREVPREAIDVLRPNLLDGAHEMHRLHAPVRGMPEHFHAELPRRLANIGIWLRRIAHQPIGLWWAANQKGLYPSVIADIQRALLHEPQRFPDPIRRGWRMLISAWTDDRAEPSMWKYDIEQRARQEGWNLSLVRDVADLYRPKLTVNPSFGIPHPVAWAEEGQPDQVVSIEVDYPHPDEGVQLPDEFVSYAVDCFRTNLDLAVALERDLSGTDWVYLETSRGPDGGPELSEDRFGLTGPIIRFQRLMERLASSDIDVARRQIRSWPSRDEYVFARLRIWVAGMGLLNPDEAGAIFLALPDRVFWGAVHERDLLYALRDRWDDLPPNARDALEQRLLTGSFPWDANVQGGPEEVSTSHRLSRLYWLSTQGVAFTFDVDETIRTLRAAAPTWTEGAGAAIADSNAPEVFSVSTDNRPDPILETPISEILRHVQEVPQLNIAERTERYPFRGLAVKRPVRALAALTHAARSGDAPRGPWADFLRAETRPADSRRTIRAIAALLHRLPPASLRVIAYPVSEWMKVLGNRLYDDAANVLPGLWDTMMTALRSAEIEQRHRPPRSWSAEALNAPVGKLFEVLMKDPAKNGLGAAANFPPHWTARLDNLLGLPGDMRRHALVMLGSQIIWLFTIDPVWTERRLLRLVEDSGPDGAALWDGVLGRAVLPPRSLFRALKAALLARATESCRRNQKTVLAGFLLAGWGDDATIEERLVTDIELREVLIHADDTFRQQLLWQLGQWSGQPNSSWRARVIPFFQQVWPKQRAVHTPAMSGHLANFALASGDLMPAVVELILRRLVPSRNTHLRFNRAGADHQARAYPAATLDLLWAVLAEEASSWPYQIGDALELLAQAPETASDARLTELRRRLDLA